MKEEIMWVSWAGAKAQQTCVLHCCVLAMFGHNLLTTIGILTLCKSNNSYPHLRSPFTHLKLGPIRQSIVVLQVSNGVMGSWKES